MTHIYVTSNDLKLGVSQGRLSIRRVEDEQESSVPFSSVDSINVFGGAQLTTQLIRECLKNGVPIGYYAEDGHYYGRIASSSGIDPERQKLQVLLSDNEAFCLEWSKIIVGTKIKNSIALLDSMPDVCIFSEREKQPLIHSLESLSHAESIECLLGLEGNAAKAYFRCLAKLVLIPEFAFEGRSTRPPRDPINSMLSYGYSLLTRNVIGAIERHGLHPYFAFMHKIKREHAALASDLIEEYRAPLIDKLVVTLVNSGEISHEDFSYNEDGSVYLGVDVMRRLTNLFSEIMGERAQYFAAYDDGRFYSFQSMLDRKINGLVDAIYAKNPSLYQPFVWVPSDEAQ